MPAGYIITVITTTSLGWERWLIADPASTVDGLNLYRFCRSNQVTLLDEKGMAPIWMATLLKRDMKKSISEGVTIIVQAQKILKDKTEAVEAVMTTFFGDNSDEPKERWNKDLVKVQEFMSEIDVDKNALKSSENEMGNAIAAIVVQKPSFYLEYKNAKKRVYQNADFMNKDEFKRQPNEKEKIYKAQKKKNFSI